MPLTSKLQGKELKPFPKFCWNLKILDWQWD